MRSRCGGDASGCHSSRCGRNQCAQAKAVGAGGILCAHALRYLVGIVFTDVENAPLGTRLFEYLYKNESSSYCAAIGVGVASVTMSRMIVLSSKSLGVETRATRMSRKRLASSSGIM